MSRPPVSTSAATEQFGQILRRVVAEQGMGLLLVEHDMSLVMEVCEHIYVLDFGSMIFDGSPRAVRSSDRGPRRVPGDRPA